MPYEETRAEVVGMIARFVRCAPEELGDDTDLKVVHNLDSLTGLRIVAAVEKRFGVCIPPEELDCYASVRTIVEAIERSRAGGAAPGGA